MFLSLLVPNIIANSCTITLRTSIRYIALYPLDIPDGVLLIYSTKEPSLRRGVLHGILKIRVNILINSWNNILYLRDWTILNLSKKIVDLFEHLFFYGQLHHILYFVTTKEMCNAHKSFLFLIPQPDGVILWYFKLEKFDLTEIIVLKFNDIRLQRYWN